MADGGTLISGRTGKPGIIQPGEITFSTAE